MPRIARIAILGLLGAAVAAAAHADLRTRTIRLVAEDDWEPSPSEVTVSVELNAEGENAEKFAGSFGDYVQQAFEKRDYPVADSAPLEVRFTIDSFDSGKWVKRYFKGDGVVLGTITVVSGGKTVGHFRYSSRLRGGFAGTSVNMMAKEVGPPLVLKLTNGERDEHLHGEE